jgi:hypothetical protein
MSAEKMKWGNLCPVYDSLPYKSHHHSNGHKFWQDLKLYAWKCGQEEESNYCILFQCPDLAGHRMKIFSFAWVELIDVSRASDRF